MRPEKDKTMMILIAGPYRSGTNDDPVLIQKNVNDMESYALPLFRVGHIPILGEWLALPLVAMAGSKKIGDEAFNEIFHPIAIKLAVSTRFVASTIPQERKHRFFRDLVG